MRRSPLLLNSLSTASLAMFVVVGGCSKKDPPVGTRGPYVEVPEAKLKGVVRTNLDSPNPTQGQLERKKKSIAIVKEMNLPAFDGLPVVEDDATTKLRTQDDVASRCLATAFCALKGESNDQKIVDSLVERYSARSFFSPNEQRFLQNPKPSQQELTDFGWTYECVHVFLWALGYLPELNPPHQMADVKKAVAILRDKGPQHFSSDAKLRSVSEVLDQADLYYRLHWAALELRLKDQKSDRANEEIISERHRALNWLVRYMNQAWDDVTTDT